MLLTDNENFDFLLYFAFIPARYNTALLGTESLPGGLGAQIWTFLTYAFLHADFIHVGVNSIWFLPFGSAMARRFGIWRFLGFFAVTAIAGAALHLLTRPRELAVQAPDPIATKLKMNSSFPDTSGLRHYNVYRVPAGFGVMFGAGALSGLLGIGSGALKVVAMDQSMKIPFKVSTTTSNFMIGVTAAASAGVYLSRGYIDPSLAMPVMLGVLIGSLMGTRVLVKTKTKSLRLVFSIVIVLLGIEMLIKGIGGKF